MSTLPVPSLKSSPSTSASRGRAGTAAGCAERDHGSSGSAPARTASTAAASAVSRVKTLTQSSERQAGSTPVVVTSPRVGLSPTIPFIAAGTRPEPAVSVPRANGTTPDATATALPELDPPAIRSPPNTLSGAP